MVTVSYPGVYIQEVPSGVRTITGVSTSVAAFVGSTKRGPLNKAIRILSYRDYERRFGGLLADTYLGHAVRQFFLNGGTEAWVVRVAQNATAAYKELEDSKNNAVLKLTAQDEGKSGNKIEVWVDYQTSNPASTFNLTLIYTDPDDPTGSISETFPNLSMNSQDANYVEDKVVSKLIKEPKRLVSVPNLNALKNGTSKSGQLKDESGKLLDVAKLVDETHNQLRISVNGSDPVDIQINIPGDRQGSDEKERLSSLCKAITRKVQAQGQASSNNALSRFLCEPDDNTAPTCIVMKSGEKGETSSVRVLGGLQNDAAGRLKLGTVNGGIETDAAAEIRPKEMPDPGTLTSGELQLPAAGQTSAIPNSNASCFNISIDGYGPDKVDIGDANARGSKRKERLQNVAQRIQAEVRKLKQYNSSYSKFVCSVEGTANNPKLKLASGRRGKNSSVVVTSAKANDIAASLELLAGISGAFATEGVNEMLERGNESPIEDGKAYNTYISPGDHKGIYALKNVDLFNLLCLPDIVRYDSAYSSILMDAVAYCKERRAFLIADAPQKSETPTEMEKTISGTTLPKTEYGAVYYPWLKIGDPLKGGKLEDFPPSGTIAGLYARTDSTRGVWKAPAGTDATLTGVQGINYLLTDRENGTLNPLGVNCIRLFPGYGAVAWGARTLRGNDQMTSEYKYIPVRRLALYIEESLYRGTKWVVFEPNDEPLWAKIRLNIGAFMMGLFRQGAFQGTTPNKAFYVKCDGETTTQYDRNRGIVNIEVGFAPLKPAEFVIIRIQQMAGELV